MMKRQLLITSFLFIVVVFVVASAVTNYNSTKKEVLGLVEAETEKLLYNFTEETNRFSTERVTELELMSDYLSFIVDDQQKIQSFLHKQNDDMPYFVGLGFISPSGEILTADGLQFPVKQRDSFESALAGQVVFSDIFTFHQDPSKKVTAISLPVKKDGEIVGVISGVVNMSDIIGKLVLQSDLPGTLFLVKGKTIVFSSRNKNMYDVIPNVELLLNEMDNKIDGNWLVDKKTAHYVMFKKSLNDWTVVVDSASNPEVEKIAASFWKNVFYILITCVIVLCVYLYIHQIEKQEQNRNKRDLLTGLGNRLKLEEDLTRRLIQFPNKPFTLLLINLDRFKEVNERIGYQMGDRILFAVKDRLKQLGGKENLYRVGGDEFVLISNAESIVEQKSLAHSIVQTMEQPTRLNKYNSIWLTVSIGVRTSMKDDQVDLIMQDATFAWQEANKKGGNQYVYFTEKLATISGQHRLLVNHLNKALENNEFYLLYQPIYSLLKDQVVSFETLMRWKSPVLGEIGPVDFIPLLEESELIIPVGRWLIREVASQVKRWDDEGYNNLIVTLNISVKQLLHPNFLSDVRKIIKETCVRPEMLVFELTESVVVQNIELASQILITLKALGIKAALDDFGTGYSSLSILKTLPIDYLKVDRAFVKEVESDGGVSGIILKGIIDIAEGLELTTIMEGVETYEQLTLLEQMGAHRIQGYFISKPIRPDDAIQLIAQESNV